MEFSQRQIPHMVTIREAAKTGILTEYTLRRLIKDGSLPTRTLYVGGKILLNLDLLIENLNKTAPVGSEPEQFHQEFTR